METTIGFEPEVKDLIFEATKLGINSSIEKKVHEWTQLLQSRISRLSQASRLQLSYGALHAFLQSNVTGPPLQWSPAEVILSPFFHGPDDIAEFQRRLITGFTVDGETIYRLTPNVELFYVAKLALDLPENGDPDVVLGRVRCNAWHQRLLSGIAPSLQNQIYDDWDLYEGSGSRLTPELLIEKASIDTLHGLDKESRQNLREAARRRNFNFALTGRLGKRTKFQQKDLSQLVVLAKSADTHADGAADTQNGIPTANHNGAQTDKRTLRPDNLDLNDDTLLESISFSKEEKDPKSELEGNLPPSLLALDPAEQPPLNAVDSIILLATASSVTNTSPQDGLTREETLPYATRVLSSPSTNWQVYTQALIVRSRIEGYRSRTTERGLLQLQAVVDQVIADTQGNTSAGSPTDSQNLSDEADAPSTFLPRPKSSESAPAEERLQYIHLLASPTRWDLEAELASRWVSMGGLRTALEIYERLEMWAEVSLCWAAQDREDEAKRILKAQLFDQQETPNGLEQEKSPLPNDAPRLFCILGDLDKDPAYYDRAWSVSKQRYARAQRSLGRLYVAKKDLHAADEAYTKSLKVSHLDHSIWFAIGCVRLQLEDWPGAIDAFGHAVQIEESDAESWSNMAAALMRLPAKERQAGDGKSTAGAVGDEDKQEALERTFESEQKNTRAAFQSLKRAAALKRDSHRIWQNLLTVSIQLAPPPYADIVIAQTRLIELLGKSQGEGSIDIPVIESLVSFLTRTPENDIPGSLRKSILNLLLNTIPPLITTSPKLHGILARLHTFLSHPAAALASYEKAWRAVTTHSSTEWENGPPGNEKTWRLIVDTTIDLADAYESFGQQPRDKGLGEGEPVEKGWKFKARSAIRSVLGRGRAWEEDGSWGRLKTRFDELR